MLYLWHLERSTTAHTFLIKPTNHKFVDNVFFVPVDLELIGGRRALVQYQALDGKMLALAVLGRIGEKFAWRTLHNFPSGNGGGVAVDLYPEMGFQVTGLVDPPVVFYVGLVV